ncbi:MAG: hemerythrin domain-containing protein [Helicobacteraceae bacterium]|nr:hemerythrin domain-containing protein [Helicobacteraceae bacterium]
MSTIKDYLTTDHRECDEIFAKMEEIANDKDIATAKELYQEFAERIEHHFQMEERVMFLEFENKTGMTQGPTQMMRMEHQQMRSILSQMGDSIEASNNDKFFGLSETLMIMMQQHNMKEEQMLYTMAQQHLSADNDRVLDMMQSMVTE